MTDIEKGAFNNVKYIIEKAPMNNINKIEFDVGSIIYQNIQTLLNLIKTQQKALEQKDKEIRELKKYDIRNIELKEDKILRSPSFTQKELDLMNLGIALSSSFDKLFNDESEE